MDVEFYFDPICPWCWITSRWLITVKNNREGINITWRPFSLAMKNNELGKDDDGTEGVGHRSSHRVLRVILAADKTGADVGELYSAFGNQKHVNLQDYDDETIARVLDEQKLSADLLKSADDTSLDAELETSMNSALEVTGKDVGTPITVFKKDGQRFGYFGPVITSLPSVSDCLKLWDGLSAMATTKEFYELKRSRDGTDADTASTTVCIP